MRWIVAFYNATLGPGAAIPGGAITGMPLSELVAAWTDPFRSTDSVSLEPRILLCVRLIATRALVYLPLSVRGIDCAPYCVETTLQAKGGCPSLPIPFVGGVAKL